MYWGWKPYVSVAQRRAKAEKFAKQKAKNLGRSLQPISIQGNKIAKTFWGKAWCDHLERYCDYANRLPRGRTYVRNGSVIDLHVAEGMVSAFVSGSEIYTVDIKIEKLKSTPWKKICGECSRSIDSLLDLLQGKLSDGVMKRLTHPHEGLFPQPNEIRKSCSCPDGADMCKHVAAVLYGVGSRLDKEPQLLFTLRGVDHLELIAVAATNDNLEQSLQGDEANALSSDDLGAIFGIELEGGSSGNIPSSEESPPAAGKSKTRKMKNPVLAKPPTTKKAVSKKVAAKRPASSRVVAANSKKKVSASKSKTTAARRKAS